MSTHCVHCCGDVLNTGEGRILVGFTLAELVELACSHPDPVVRRRVLCAIGLLDIVLADETRSALQDAGLLPRAAEIE